MKIKFNYKNKEFFLDGRKCESFFSKLRGLMFRSKKYNEPLIFVFKKPIRIGIHSFFVRNKFLALWLRNNKVVDGKIVNPWTLSVKPKEDFDMLIEIPITTSSGFLESSNQRYLDTF